MQRLLGIGQLLVLLAVLVALPACNKTTDSAGGPPPGAPPFPPGMGGPGFRPGPPSGPIGKIMDQLHNGDEALTKKIGKELNEDPPPWDKIQPQTKEHVNLTKSLAQHEPPKGSKEAWKTHTDEYTKLATELDKAAQAKDKDKALAAQKQITGSCKSCHQEHRPPRPPGGGFGPPGGWPPGGGRPGGPPGGGPPGGGRPGGPPGPPQ